MSSSDSRTDEEPTSKPADAKPTSKPADPKPQPESKPADAKPQPAKPADPESQPESKPADAKPASKPADAKPQPAKPAPKPPVKKAEEAPLPAFEKGLSDKVTAKFGDKAEIRFIKPNRIGLKVQREDVRDVALYLRDELSFDHAESVSGVDYPQDGEIEVVYHLGSYTDDSLSGQVLELATRAPREDVPNPGNDSTVLPSLREVFYSVEFHERECFEMLGVYFKDHPDNRRLLLPEDWADLPPLRKDFEIKGR